MSAGASEPRLGRSSYGDDRACPSGFVRFSACASSGTAKHFASRSGDFTRSIHR